ncbi:B12-binding domain-containing radical SAM protein [Desulforegula conservatrix]|uniref:B12-binding domain-containing radical SAM protein n=1 Tax=Desulforegula conservatrix TaxID=153026 RepID=UPI00042344A7|nr:radical SAM protein [Desulforegula conservatrix]
MVSIKNRKIILVQPPIRDFYFTSKRSIPYGLLSIAASLRKSGFDVSLIDGLATSRSRKISVPEEMNYLAEFYGREDISPLALFNGYKHFGYGFENIAKRAAETGAFLVGISSLFTAYSEVALQTAKSIKSVMPDAYIVMGGHHATAIPEHLLENSYVDFVITGEGEHALPMLSNALLSGSPLTDIPGLVYKDDNKRIIKNERAIVHDLSEIPIPALDLMDHGFYSRKDGGSAVITSSRGCPLKCSYCCVGSANIRWRKRNPEQIIEEIKTAVEIYGARFIDFEDENLSLDKVWFNEILDAVIDEFPGLELRAMNGLFPPSLYPELMMKMRMAGFRTLNLSVGSTSREQLEKFGRPDIMDCLDEVLENAGKAGLECVCYVIAGGPGQSLESSVDDLVYFSSRNALVGVSVYYPAPGSRDYALLSGSGQLPGSFSLMRSSAMPLSKPEDRIKTATVMRLGRILNFMKSLDKMSIQSLRPEKLAMGTIHFEDRVSAGISLINSFLYDFKIRGIEKNGYVYEHSSCEELCKRFAYKLDFL